MGQVTSATIKMIRDHIARGEHPPITLREIGQLVAAWERGQPAASAEPAVWVAADTLYSAHPTCISSLAYMSQIDHDRGREYVPLAIINHHAAPVAQEPVCYLIRGKASHDEYIEDAHWAQRRKEQRMDAFSGEDETEIIPLYAAPVTAQAQHPDDAAVEAFAAAMKAKLAQKRAEGRGGWEDKTQCSQDDLSLMLRGHVSKGDPVDVANFCMMLHQRGERISSRDAASPSAQAQRVVNQQMTTAASDVLADTQRAIIEAAERRGYERAIAECAQDREDAERWRHIVRKVCAIGTSGSGYEFQVINLPRPLGNPMQGSVAQHFEDAIDADRAAKEADHA